LSKRALKHCLFIALFNFSVYLLVKLFALPELIGLVNKDLHKKMNKESSSGQVTQR